MTKTRFTALAATLGLALAAGSVGRAEQQTPAASKPAPPHGPWIGTWQRNPEKSTGNASAKAIFDMQVEGDGFRFTFTATPPSGPPTRMEGYAKFDGKPYPEKGNPIADHNVFTRIDDHTYSVIDLKEGKETMRFKVTISPDGKTRTSVSTSRNAEGKEVTNVGVWDRIK